MLIVGERINSTRKPVQAALAARDAEHFRQEARRQVEAGAAYLDVNAAAVMADEIPALLWLIELVQGEVDVPLAIDSPNPAAIEAGLRAHRGKALVNSITAEKERSEAILPLVASHGASVVGLTINDSGMPSSAQERLAISRQIVELAGRYGVEPERIYIDPLVRPVGTEYDQGKAVVEAVRMIRAELPVHCICGLSNIGFGLPARSLLNRTFLAMLMAAGLDSALVDPLDQKLMATLRAAEALLGQDEYCMQYLTCHRAGILEG